MPDNDTELIKAGTQGIVEGAMKPFGDLIQALFGPATSEAGMILKESVQHFRLKRQIRLFHRTKKVLAHSGIRPTHVSLKLLVPIIENASYEEDDKLQDVWANLLANAADPEEPNKVYPSFPAILRELTARDVKFLDSLFLSAQKQGKGANEHISVERATFSPGMLTSIYSHAGLGRQCIDSQISSKKLRSLEDAQANARAMRLSLDTFERHGVIVRVYGVARESDGAVEVGMLRSFSSLGACFIMACRDPRN